MLDALRHDFAHASHAGAIATMQRLIQSALNNDMKGFGLAELIRCVPDSALKDIDPMSKARLLYRLSQSMRKNGPGRRKMRACGMRLVTAMKIPDGMDDEFTRLEATFTQSFLSKLYPKGKRHRIDPDQKLSVKDVDDMAHHFVALFAQTYDLKEGIISRVSREIDPKNTGRAEFDAITKSTTVTSNISEIKTVADLPKLAVILGHECFHAYAMRMRDYTKNLTKDQWENLRRDEPDTYIFLAMVDRKFYTVKNQKIYERHPEEILAERTGLRLGAAMGRALGLKPDIKELAKSILLYPSAALTAEIARLCSRDPDALPPARRRAREEIYIPR